MDLSHIEDPLLSQAGNYGIEGPATPPRTPVADRKSLDLPEGKLHLPTSRPQTPQLDADSGSDYDSLPEEMEIDLESHLLLHTRVYALAEKYEIPSLKYLARAKF